jgi:hypothetical protein
VLVWTIAPTPAATAAAFQGAQAQKPSTRPQGFDRLRRRHDLEADVRAQREPGLRQPFAEQIGVAGEAEDRRQCQGRQARGLAARDQRRQRAGGDGGVGHVALGEAGELVIAAQGHGDRSAIEIERERHRHGRPHAADAERRGDGGGAEHMGRVEQADVQLVAQIRPGHLAHEFEVQPLGLREALVLRQHDQRAIDQRHEADPQMQRHVSTLVI